ncbi:hypothetical protein AMELA_G00069120 [Ameiurus melas]|uniref:Uncharacterized protein n=1 Tax=Ameiurus melas TaxID=219545 RepID=A0A7J6B7F6_AMEME|nr:hypothetical protein AMELA_G00069120 [Ameiurus melas]
MLPCANGLAKIQVCPALNIYSCTELLWRDSAVRMCCNLQRRGSLTQLELEQRSKLFTENRISVAPPAQTNWGHHKR